MARVRRDKAYLSDRQWHVARIVRVGAQTLFWGKFTDKKLK